MPEEQDGTIGQLGSINPPNNTTPTVQQATKNLLQSLTDDSTVVTDMQIVINLQAQQTPTAVPPATSKPSGTWVRLILADGTVALRYLPDDPQETVIEETLTDADAIKGNKNDWEQALDIGGRHSGEIDIDTGIAYLRLDEETKTGVCYWVSTETGGVIRHELKGTDEGGQLDVNGWSNYRQCRDGEENNSFSDCFSTLFSG